MLKEKLINLFKDDGPLHELPVNDYDEELIYLENNRDEVFYEIKDVIKEIFSKKQMLILLDDNNKILEDIKQLKKKLIILMENYNFKNKKYREYYYNNENKLSSCRGYRNEKSFLPAIERINEYIKKEYIKFIFIN